MGMTLTVADHTVPRPRPIVLLVSCDGDHGFLPVTALDLEVLP